MVVVPSRLEAHNKVCIEAAAVRTPFVVTETTGISASVPSTGVGVVVPVDDVDALADAITRVLTREWHADAEAAGRFALQYVPDRVAGQIVDLYEDMVRRCA